MELGSHWVYTQCAVVHSSTCSLVLGLRGLNNMVAKRLAPLVWFTKNGKKHIRLRGLPDTPAIPLIDQKCMAALAAVGVTIRAFLEVDSTPEPPTNKSTATLTIATETYPFLVFPCTIEHTCTQACADCSHPSSDRGTQPRYNSREAARQLMSNARIQPRYILNGSSSSSQGDTVVISIHTEWGTMSTLALCDTGATPNLCN